MTKTTLRLGAALIAVSSHAFAQEDGIDTIVVSASPLDRTQDELLTGASVLEGEDLIRRAANTLGETLRREPGLSETGFGAGASRPIIRGLGGDRVRVLTNGVGSIDASAASPDHAVPIEPATADRIEVVRGTALLRYGSSAAGGVVNVLDGRIPDAPLDSGTGAFRAGAASVDDSVEAVGSLTAPVADLGDGKLVLNLQGAIRDAQDYEVPVEPESEILRAFEGEELGEGDDQPLENSFVETKSGSVGLSYVGERGFFGVSLQENRTRYGIPAGHAHGEEEHEGEEHDEGEEHGDEEEEGGVFIDLDQTRVDVNGRLALGEGFLEAVQLFGGYADYTHTEFEGPGEPGTVFANEGWELRVEALQTERSGWRGATGVQLRMRDFSAIGEEAFVPPTETEQYGLFTFQEVRTGPWHVEGAARIEMTDHERSTDGQSIDFTGVSGSVGAGYAFTDNFNVAATVSRTERAPTTEELFSDGPHLATNQFEVGDTSLDIETALGAEVLFHVHGERGALTLNLFHTEYDDFIYLRDTGRTGADVLLAMGEDDEEELEEFGELSEAVFTAADAQFTGFELFGEVMLGEVSGVTLTADGVLDYVETVLDDGRGDDLPRIPPLGIAAGVVAEGYGGSLRVEVDHAGEQDQVARFELPTDSFTLLNVYASYALTDRLTLRGAVLNATDAEARLATSFLKDEVPLPGRNVRVSLGYQF